jgi:hypothetical protein
MDQSAKALLRTADDGRTWQLMSAVTSITGPSPAGAMNTEDTAAISAFSPALLWMATSNFLAYSRDAGHSWTPLNSVNTGGCTGSFDVLSPADAWLLCPGAGLWRTADGLHWIQVGQYFNR